MMTRPLDPAFKEIKRKIRQDSKSVFNMTSSPHERKQYVMWLVKTYTEDIEYCQQLINTGLPLVMIRKDKILKLEHGKLKFLVNFLSKHKCELINKVS